VVGQPTPSFEPRAVDQRFRTTPYRPDTVVDGWATPELTVRGASVRGYDHRWYGVPRQDDFALAWLPERNWLVAAVADGVSAAPQSHIGAATAVRYATLWLATALPESLDQIDWSGLVANTAWSLVEQARVVLSDPAAEAAQAEELLASTLVCAVVEPRADHLAVALVGIGDSGAWLLGPDGYSNLEGGKDTSGPIASSAVSGLPRTPSEVVPIRGQVRPGQVLLLGTDGFGDPLGSGDGLVGQLFRDRLTPGPPPLLEFAHLLDFSRETFDDDRTLVAIWPHQAA
jgi:hypothetical protein